ncbi:hypothetical protein ACL6C3_02810 [Capilliphycus salinus ALCB114379]|uniref:hypothetical protein n=1 Tax=Capilliphycus salinus TaxID=2768948 RepID=UPI0039A41B09
MTVQPDRIQALISKIDEALSLSNPRPPLVVMGDTIIQSRQVLEQVRSYLLSVDPSQHQDSPNLMAAVTDAELQSLEESIRLLIREELQQWQSQLTQTIEAEIRAMRQERRVLIRELRWLRKQRQEAQTASKPSAETQPGFSSQPAGRAVFIPPQETYIYPTPNPKAPELFPYAGVEIPPSMRLDSQQIAVSKPTVEPNASVDSDREPEIDLQALTRPVELESVAPELEISAHPQAQQADPILPLDKTLENDLIEAQEPISAPGESVEFSPSSDSEVPTQKLESVAPELEISAPPQAQQPAQTPPSFETVQNELIEAQGEISPTSPTEEPTPTVISLDSDSPPEKHHWEIAGARPNDLNDVFGVLDLSESVLESQMLPSSSVKFTQPGTSPNQHNQRLDPEDYIQASPHENLLPHAQPEEEDDDQVDTHLMVGKNIRQQLEEDLLILEQQSFLGEDNSIADFYEEEDQPETSSVPSVKKQKEIDSFEQLWSETSPAEVNPFAEANASEMTLDELLTTIDNSEVKSRNSDEDRSDLDDLNFEALNHKLQP